MPDSIYARPADYDLEHEGDAEDARFYGRLVARLGARRVLELGCGSGRVLLHLAAQAAREGFDLVGVDASADMLGQAARKLDAMAPGTRRAVRLVQADIRDFASPDSFDLIIVPCSTLCHVLELDDQLRLWRQAHANLMTGGRFVADVSMPNLCAFAESMQTPPRALVEMDIDNETRDGSTRLLRYKTTFYEAHRQRARVHFLYDRFDAREGSERYVSDFESHVYYPRELQLLFRLTGFTVEATFGGYGFQPLGSASRDMLMVGVKNG